MNFKFIHNNFNVLDLEKSLAFYEKALGLKEVKRMNAEDGSFILVLQRTAALFLCILATGRLRISLN